jgi:phosphoribosyl 1,2-cyclic phosphate phosphodiesterase
VVVDTGPEFRLQALDAGITRLDAVFYTHAHADHVHGIDDLSAFSWTKPLNIYSTPAILAEIRERFSFIFKPLIQRGGGKPHLNPIPLNGPIDIGALRITPVPLKHGILDILGFRFDEPGQSGGGLAYLTDVSTIPEPSFALLSDLAVLIIDGLRVKKHETHFSFEEAMESAVRIGAPRVYITHICHEHSHAEISRIARAFVRERGLESVLSIEPASDGLALAIV